MAQHKVRSENDSNDTLYYSLREEAGQVFLEVQDGEGYENVVGVLGDDGLNLWSLDPDYKLPKDKNGHLKITRD